MCVTFVKKLNAKTKAKEEEDNGSRGRERRGIGRETEKISEELVMWYWLRYQINIKKRLRV